MRLADSETPLRRLTLLLALVVALASPGKVSASQQILGAQGEIFKAVTGSAATVLPSSIAIDPENPVLAVQVRTRDGETISLLVPGTEGTERENEPFLTFDDSTGTLFVAWEERTNFIHSRVKLASWREGEWLEDRAVSDWRLSLKFTPSMAVTRDRYHVGGPTGDDGEQQIAEVTRSVLHMVWLEERGDGPVAVYLPLLLVDGKLSGTEDLISLTEVVRPETDTSIPAAATPFPPTISRGDDDHSVVVGFYDPWSSSLVSLRVSLLAGDLAALADGSADYVLQTTPGTDLTDPDEVASIADGVRGHIIDIGVRLDPELLSHIADGVRGHIIDTGVRSSPPGAGGPEWLAAIVRGHIIDTGFRLDRRGLREMRAESSRALVEVGPRASAGDTISTPSHVLEIQKLHSWRLPDRLHEGFDTAMLSRNGDHAMLVRDLPAKVLYMETGEEGWSLAHSIPLEGEHGRPDALKLLDIRLGRF